MVGCNSLGLQKTTVLNWSEGSSNCLNSDYEYVTHITPSIENFTYAVATTNQFVKLCSMENLDIESQLRLPDEPVVEISFNEIFPQLLLVALSNGSLYHWDIRSPPVPTLQNLIEPQKKMFSFAANSNYICGFGGNKVIYLYDIRKGSKVIGISEDAHSDLVTSIMFDSYTPNELMSSSVDGLISVQNISLLPDSVDLVLNTECPVRTAGFFGVKNENIFSCSCSETLSIWCRDTGTRQLDILNIRESCSVDYLVGCYWNKTDERFYVVAGTYVGELVVIETSKSGVKNVLRTGKRISSGHSSVIRKFCWTNEILITGGEDGRLCLWKCGSTDYSESNRRASLISSQNKKKRFGRHRTIKPY